MKKNTILFAATIAAMSISAKDKALKQGYPISPVQFTSVAINDSFWGQRLKTSREVTVPLAFSKCEETGRYDNFIKAAHPNDTYKVEGFSFDDTDVYKTIEGASYLLHTYPDKKLETYIDSILSIVASAQEPDGYLNTAFTMNPKHPHVWMMPGKRWEKVEELSHEFYNLGHMIEGAIAHYQATGKRNFLDIAIKYADCVCNAIGDNPGQIAKVPGHQIAEMALAKLYLVTGEKKYLDRAKYFLDKRGYTSRKDEYSQAHKPVIEQDEAVGHAVRAGYMYSGMADVAALTGDTAYINAIDRIWENIVSKKYYITGGVGATHQGEAFGRNYELPNSSAYCETCAAIANVYVNHRLFLLHGDAKYYDVLERTLYNGLISGVSIEGDSFFYPNPLASDGGYERKAWFGCACCPSNICRFMPSLPGYVYAIKDKNIYVNLFIGNSAELYVKGKKTVITQSGNYVWDGTVSINIDSNKAGEYTLRIRIPGWVRNTPVPSDLYSYIDKKSAGYKITLNDAPIECDFENGYVVITRKWKKNDKIDLSFDMPARIVAASSHVVADRGRVAVERGPLVYCAEWPDNNFDIQKIVLNPNSGFTATRSDKLHGIVELKGSAQLIENTANGDIAIRDVGLTLIPYYSWAHRGSGQMSVWLPATPSATRSVIDTAEIIKNDFESK